MMLGIPLTYTGQDFTSLGATKTVPPSAASTGTSAPGKQQHAQSQVKLFTELSSALGSVIMNLNLMPRGRMALVDSTSMREEVYARHPIQKAAPGKDQEDFLWPGADKNRTLRNTMKLCEATRASVGKSKFMDNRMRPVISSNRQGLKGELHMWDIAHAPLFEIGTDLPFKMDKGGFQYVQCPENITPEEYESIGKAFESGKFTVKGKAVHVHLPDGEKALTLRRFAEIKEVAPEHDSAFSSQLSVSFDKEKGKAQPSGFIIHEHGFFLEKREADGLLKIMRIGKQGFYGLSKDNQGVLFSGFLADSTQEGEALSTQNRVINALVPLFEKLETIATASGKPFDVGRTLEKSIERSATRLREAIAKCPLLLEDLLMGGLLNEMAQPLKTTQMERRRAHIPERFLKPYPIARNNTHIVAHAYKLEDQTGQPVFQPDKTIAFSRNPDLPDVQVNGKLKEPELKKREHIAAIVAMAALVSEEVIIETLIRSVTEDIHSGATSQSLQMQGLSVLKDIFDAEETGHTDQILAMAHGIPKEKLGRQFEESDALVEFVREKLGTNLLVDFIEKLQNQDKVSPDRNTVTALKKLEKVGNILQDFPLTSAAGEESRGINAGLSPLMASLSRDNSSRFYWSSVLGVTQHTSRNESNIDNLLTIAKQSTLLYLMRDVDISKLSEKQIEKIRYLWDHFHPESLQYSPLIRIDGTPIPIQFDDSREPVDVYGDFSSDEMPAIKNAAKQYIQNYSEHHQWQIENLHIRTVTDKDNVSSFEKGFLVEKKQEGVFYEFPNEHTSDESENTILRRGTPVADFGGMDINNKHDKTQDKQLRLKAGCDKYYSDFPRAAIIEEGDYNAGDTIHEAMAISIKMNAALDQNGGKDVRRNNLSPVDIPIIKTDTGEPSVLQIFFTNRDVKKGPVGEGEQMCFYYDPFYDRVEDKAEAKQA